MFSNHKSGFCASDVGVCTEPVQVQVPSEDGSLDVHVEIRESKCNLPNHGEYDLEDLLASNVDLKPVNPTILQPNLSPSQVDDLLSKYVKSEEIVSGESVSEVVES